jgi:hypothetical protein
MEGAPSSCCPQLQVVLCPLLHLNVHAGSAAEELWFKSLTRAALSAATSASASGGAGVLGSGAQAGASVYGLGDANGDAAAPDLSDEEQLVRQLAGLAVTEHGSPDQASPAP